MLPETHQLPIRFYIYGDTVLFIEETDADFRSLEITDERVAKEMKNIFEQFLDMPKNVKESEQQARELDLYLVRHGEAESQEKNALLSSHGKLQAEVEAITLLTDIWGQGGGLLKIYNSPTPRAKETSEIIDETTQKIIKGSSQSPIKRYTPRMSGSLEAPGVIGNLMKKGIPYEKTIEYWLNNPETVEGKSPKDINERLKSLLRKGQGLANRLPAGEKIYYVGVTHEVPQAALLNQITGKTLNELGGGIKNCESIKIEFKSAPKQSPTLSFRDIKMNIQDSIPE